MRLHLLALILVTAVPATAAPFPIGSWYTEGSENGLQEQILFTDHPDGTLEKLAVDDTDCNNVRRWKELGKWALDGETYTNITSDVGGVAVDASSPEFNDSFALKRLDDDHVALFDAKTGTTWALRRVADDFALPPPPNCPGV